MSRIMEGSEQLSDTIFHESSQLDKSIYFSLYQYKYFTYILFYYSIFQLLVVPGFTIISPFVSAGTIVFCVFVYYNLSLRTISFDVKYEKVSHILRMYTLMVVVLLIASVADIILTFVFSSEEIGMLLDLNDFHKIKFAILVCFIIFSKATLFIFLLVAQFFLQKKISIFKAQDKQI